VKFPVISDRCIQGLNLHRRTEVVINKLDLGIRMLIVHPLPFELAPSVPSISSYVDLDRSTLIQDQEDRDMVVDVGSVRPCPNGMDGDAHPRECRSTVGEIILVSFIERDYMGDIGGYSGRPWGRKKRWCVSAWSWGIPTRGITRGRTPNCGWDVRVGDRGGRVVDLVGHGRGSCYNEGRFGLRRVLIFISPGP
jgi:hypothetical protein